jgi:DNA-binding transcriptional MocR family regulator
MEPEVLVELAALEGLEGVMAMAQGNGDSRLHPTAPFMACLRSVERRAPDLLGYGPAAGLPELRAELAARLRRRDIEVEPAQVIVTSGVTQALDLVVGTLCRPGDKVLVESPTYLGMLAILRKWQVSPVPVPFEEAGPNLDAFARALHRDRPRLYYTVPTFHNPTGRTISLGRRAEILGLAREHDLLIVEDDICRDIQLVGDPPRAFKALDGFGQVIYTDGFSKSLMPGVRTGYLLPPRRLMARLVDTHRTRSLCGPGLMQAALTEFLHRGQLESHLERVLPIYRDRRLVLLGALEAHMPPGVSWTEPEGGYCLWLKLPGGVGSSDGFRAAMSSGVAVAPGDPFLPAPDGSGHLRLSFGGIDSDSIAPAVERLAQGLRGVTVEAVARPPLADLMPLV